MTAIARLRGRSQRLSRPRTRGSGGDAVVVALGPRSSTHRVWWFTPDRPDPLRQAWEEYVLPHVDLFDRDHYETVWNAVVRKGPAMKPF